MHQPVPAAEKYFPKLETTLEMVTAGILNHWVKPDGSFRSRRLMFGWDNVPMHRWGQSQMFAASRFICMKRRRRTPKFMKTTMPNFMCGICGQLNFAKNEPVNPETIRRMSRSMLHRGPDDDGEFISGPVGLGFRRLSIIDLAGGAPANVGHRRHGPGGFQRRNLQFS